MIALITLFLIDSPSSPVAGSTTRVCDGIDRYGFCLEHFEEEDIGKPLQTNPAKPVCGQWQRIGIGHDPSDDSIDRRSEPVGEFWIDASIVSACQLVLANSGTLKTNIHSVSLSRHIAED